MLRGNSIELLSTVLSSSPQQDALQVYCGHGMMLLLEMFNFCFDGFV